MWRLHGGIVSGWAVLKVSTSARWEIFYLEIKKQEAINNDTTAGKATRDQRKLGQIRTRRSKIGAFLQSGQGQI